MTTVSDALLDADLSLRIPVVVSIDNSVVYGETLKKLLDYLNGGGKMLVYGDFAVNAEGSALSYKNEILMHSGCKIAGVTSQVAVCGRVLREMFLSGYRTGVNGYRYIYDGLDFQKLYGEILGFSPETVLAPFIADGYCRGVNVYPLTDRESMIAVCINNDSDEAVFSLQPDPRLINGDLCVLDAVTGEPVEMPVILQGHTTRMLFFAQAPHDDFEEIICKAEDAFETWESHNANVGALRHYYSGMRSGAHKEKRYALAKCLLRSIAIKAEVFYENDGDLRVSAELLAAGSLERDAKVRMRITPGVYRWYSFHEEAGTYVCSVPAEDMPLVYDPDQMDYVKITKTVRIIIQAEDRIRQGGCVVNVKL
jgi:hypothetical protein